MRGIFFLSSILDYDISLITDTLTLTLLILTVSESSVYMHILGVIEFAWL